MSLFLHISRFFRSLHEGKFVIFQLARRDYKNRYIGSALGFFWTILQPLAMVFVLWFVFTKGLRVAPVKEGIPFLSWLVVALAAWNFFSEVWLSATGVFHEYAYLIKQVKFNIVVLPFVKLFSYFFIHIIFILIAVVFLYLEGINFSLYWFQVFYYLFAMMVLVLGLSWITASLQIFYKDVAQFVAIILQFGFWMTPIIWSVDLLSQKWQFLMSFNPMFYIVDGYRKSFIYGQPFWIDWHGAVYFWVVNIFFLLLGGILFRRLRSHFADVL